MDDDLAFLRARVPGYAGYGDESQRHDTDIRVRAFAGERLSRAQTRLAGSLAPDVAAALEHAIFACQFSDQHFVKRLEHAELDGATLAALERSDRAIVELAERLDDVSASELGPVVKGIEAQLSGRGAPLPAPGHAG